MLNVIHMLLACWNIEPELDDVVMANILFMGRGFYARPSERSDD